MFHPEYFQTRSQDLEAAYHDAGQFYWYTYERFFSDDHPWGETTCAYILPSYRAQDIDTQEDWIRAELMFKALQDVQR